MSNTATVPAGAQTPTTSNFTATDWAVLVLQDGGFPISSNNLAFMSWWMANENSPQQWTGTAGANNPLNNGLGSGGGAGLGSYPDLATSAAYAAKNLNAPNYGYPAIAAALRASADPSITVKALEASSWASGHYGGQNYSPVSLNDVTAEASAVFKGGKGPTSGPVVLGDTAKAANAIIAEAQAKVSGVEGNSPSVPGADQVAAAVGGASGVEAAASKILNELGNTQFWERIGLFVAGLALVGVGIAVFISTTKTGQKLESDAAVAALA